MRHLSSRLEEVFEVLAVVRAKGGIWAGRREGVGGWWLPGGYGRCTASFCCSKQLISGPLPSQPSDVRSEWEDRVESLEDCWVVNWIWGRLSKKSSVSVGWTTWLKMALSLKLFLLGRFSAPISDPTATNPNTTYSSNCLRTFIFFFC